jgi:Putative zinc-RING and/or ribbon/PX domain
VNKNGGSDNSLDDMVLEMEEILLDSESHSPRSNTDNRYKSHAATILVHHSRGGSSSASTSGTDDSYQLRRNPKSIDSVELIGAKQKKGNVSFGERLVGVKEYTVYIFKVRNGSNIWEVERRYRDFYSLYRQLKALFTAHGLTLPLPWSHVESESKKVFGNSSPTVIADRSVLLQECLSSILTSSYPFGIPTPLLTFLSPGKTLTSSVPSNSPSKNLIPSDFMGKKISLMVDVRAHKSVRQLLELQHHTCAGCHRPMDSESTFLRELAQTVGWSRNFRFCEYTGQLFCTVCHVNDTAVIPGRVLHGWDFTLYPVSQLAKAYLESINDQPMLCVSAVNPFLFSKVPALLHIMGLRKKIAAMLPYITCPFRKSVEKGLRTRRYLLECNDFFALRDLVDLSKGVFAGFPVMVERLHKKIEEHITQQCLVCYDAGVPCAARSSCHDPFSLIFPFQVPTYPAPTLVSCSIHWSRHTQLCCVHLSMVKSYTRVTRLKWLYGQSAIPSIYYLSSEENLV